MVAFTRFFSINFGLHQIRKTGRSHPFTFHEAVLGSLSLRLTPLSHGASPVGITPNCARLTTCTTSNLHGELLSVH
jgi:hypothetical protein